MWSKDIVFLVSDSYTEGAQAWLDAYHGYSQPRSSTSFTRSSLTRQISPPMNSASRLAPSGQRSMSTIPTIRSRGLDYSLVCR